MRAAVAGAGIAGLTAAIALARRGWSVELCERQEVVEEVGAGIQLSPNAMAVLDRLGLAAELRGALVEPKAVAIYDAPSGTLLNHVPLGQTARSRYGSPYAVIHRADLHAGLLRAAVRQNAIRFRPGAELGQAQCDPGRVTFVAGGEAGDADILVVAEGIGSRLRREFFGHAGPQPSGRTAWRATIPLADAPQAIPRDVTGLWLAPGAHVVHYPLRSGGELNIVAIAADCDAARPPHHAFGDACRFLLDAAPAWRRWPLSAIDPRPPWARGRVALVGDAAHATLPSAAQGGALAIEDAWVLAAVLAGKPADPARALARYESLRRGRVARVVRQSRRNLRLYELSGAAARLRNVAIRAIPPGVHLARLDWLYGWKPAENP